MSHVSEFKACSVYTRAVVLHELCKPGNAPLFRKPDANPPGEDKNYCRIDNKLTISLI